MNNKEIIKSNNNTLRKVKNFPSATSIWNNSIYSFNQNYLKNIPAVDNIVNKLIKSFFSINALANNPKGNKSKLIQRRYKRLSLNKILVSKSEIKHNNDKVFITVYLFNKKKKSLLLKLKNLSQSLGGSPLVLKSLSLDNKNNELALKREAGPSIENLSLNSNKNSDTSAYHISEASPVQGSKYKILSYKLRLGASLVKERSNSGTATNKSLFNNIALNKYVDISSSNNVENNSYAIPYLNNGVSNIMRNNKFYDRSAQSLLNLKPVDNIVSKSDRTILDNNAKGDFLEASPTILYYKNLNLVTRYNIHMFTNLFNNKKTVVSNNTSLETSPHILSLKNTDLRNYYKLINKYKIYNNVTSTLSSQSAIKNDITKYDYINNANAKPNYSVYKLKSVNKLFTLYNNVNLGLDTSSVSNTESLYTNKILLNTYKLLKKSYSVLSSNLGSSITGETNPVKPNTLGNSPLSPYNVAYMSRKNPGQNNVKSNYYTIKGLDNRINANKSYISMKKSMRNIILINKLNRIDRFFDKYKNTLISATNKSALDNTVLNNIISNYKVNFISELMEKELLYIYYLKLLSYNNIVFKNWFLYSLKNLISKIYNKKVVFNLVNLKYIHLNSDILSQAVNIRLRNFKKNRVVKVLKKVIKLVPISKVNIYACDEHSSIYKYVNNFHNKFRNLKLDIFKELGLENNDKTTLKGQGGQGPRRNGSLRKLSHIQANTINFIKYKSAFGVRLEAAGRLTKRSTASRSIFKYRYNGTLRNNAIINNNISSVIIKDNRISNLQFTQISSKTRNGSFGLKGWINNN